MTTTLTFIDTNQLPRVKTPHAEVTEIPNPELTGAKSVFGALRRLPSIIRLDGQDYEVSRGTGVYLGPSETAAFQAGSLLKLFHFAVPDIPAQ